MREVREEEGREESARGIILASRNHYRCRLSHRSPDPDFLFRFLCFPHSISLSLSLSLSLARALFFLSMRWTISLLSSIITCGKHHVG